jgi:hypothetical protein
MLTVFCPRPAPGRIRPAAIADGDPARLVNQVVPRCSVRWRAASGGGSSPATGGAGRGRPSLLSQRIELPVPGPGPGKASRRRCCRATWRCPCFTLLKVQRDRRTGSR